MMPDVRTTGAKRRSGRKRYRNADATNTNPKRVVGYIPQPPSRKNSVHMVGLLSNEPTRRHRSREKVRRACDVRTDVITTEARKARNQNRNHSVPSVFPW